MKEQLESKIQDIIKTQFNITKEVYLTIPPSKDLGDFSTNIAFVLSKELKKNPKEIAEIIISSSNIEELSKLEIAGPGFINLYLNQNNFIITIIDEILSNSNYPELNIGQNQTISIEHTAANPNKHLHVGHLRNFSIADTLVKIMKKGGYSVTVQWFNDDQGLQVAKVLWGTKHLSELKLDDYNEGKFDTWAAKVYVETEKYLLNNQEKEIEVREIIHAMEEGNNEIAQAADLLTKKIIEGQITTTSKFGVKYDLIISESTMTQSGEVERIINDLLKTGKVSKEIEGKNAGAIVIKGILDSEGKSLDDKILIRSDGTAVYTGKDIVLHLWKFGLNHVDFEFIPFESNIMEWNNNNPLFITTPHKVENSKQIFQSAKKHINVVDQRQTYPLEVVKQSLKLLGYENQSSNLHHLGYETVTLSKEAALLLGFEVEDDSKTVTMSGRKGIEVSIDSLLDLMTKEIYETSHSKGTELSIHEISQIASSALSYYMIKYSYNTIIIFDIKDALRSDGDTGIYLMYAYVRANNIISKTTNNSETFKIPENIDSSITDLLTFMSLSKDILEKTITSYEVNKLANYTFELAKKFSDFYQNVNVLKENDLETQAFYLNIVKSFKILYSNLLDTLGIYKPEKM